MDSTEPEFPNANEGSTQIEINEKSTLLARVCKRFWRFTEKTGEMAIKPFKGIL